MAGICLVLILLGVRHLWRAAERPLDREELRIVRRLSDRIRSDEAFPFDY